jgi:hypothetical protein
MGETAQQPPSIDAIPDVDIAVIGGGVAGCYTAWRLRTLTKEALVPNSPLLPLFDGKDRLSVGLFEYSDRIGGRLLSAALNGIPNEFAEFGGMRFYKQMHIVWNLIEKLGLSDRAIPFPVTEPHNMVYVRGEHLRSGQIASKSYALPYRLRYLEKGKSADELVDFVCEMAIEGFAKLRGGYAAAFADGDWDKVGAIRILYEAAKGNARIGTRTVYDMSWWELQTCLLSNEAFEFILATSGYDVTNTNGNAAHALDQLFYAPNDWEFYRLSHGFDELPDKLQEEFQEHGGRTYMQHQLLGFDKLNSDADGGPYKLHFHKGNDIPGAVGGNVEATAKMVVLAMPLRSLELLDQNNFFFKPGVRKESERKTLFDAAMNSVLNVPAFKLFLAYRYPWWERTGVSKGQAVTDLPVRQCYYWASAPGGNAVLMATYNNGVAVPYWQSLQKGEPFIPDKDNDSFQGRAFGYVNRVAQRLRPAEQKVEPTGLTPMVITTATNSMVERAHAQLMELHDVKYAPAPYDAHFQDWTVDPFGGAWHQWKSGSDEKALIPYMQQPMEEEQVFIVGECWSDAQGWVQGALNTSEAMLQDRMGLSWPQWLQEGGTWLGPRKKQDGG